MNKLVCITAVLMVCCGCVGSKWPTVQNKTIVFGLEVETMGNALNGDSPVPKLRAGLIFHEGQIVPPDTKAELKSDYADLNLWTGSGTMSGLMAVDSCDSDIAK